VNVVRKMIEVCDTRAQIDWGHHTRVLKFPEEVETDQSLERVVKNGGRGILHDFCAAPHGAGNEMHEQVVFLIEHGAASQVLTS
jgi:hypothetical protein